MSPRPSSVRARPSSWRSMKASSAPPPSEQIDAYSGALDSLVCLAHTLVLVGKAGIGLAALGPLTGGILLDPLAGFRIDSPIHFGAEFVGIAAGDLRKSLRHRRGVVTRSTAAATPFKPLQHKLVEARRCRIALDLICCQPATKLIHDAQRVPAKCLDMLGSSQQEYARRPDHPLEASFRSSLSLSGLVRRSRQLHRHKIHIEPLRPSACPLAEQVNGCLRFC